MLSNVTAHVEDISDPFKYVFTALSAKVTNGEHAALPGTLLAPFGHARHVLLLVAASAVEYLSAAHFTHDDAPDAVPEYVPAGQGVHVASLVAPA